MFFCYGLFEFRQSFESFISLYSMLQSLLSSNLRWLHQSLLNVTVSSVVQSQVALVLVMKGKSVSHWDACNIAFLFFCGLSWLAITYIQ